MPARASIALAARSADRLSSRALAESARYRALRDRASADLFRILGRWDPLLEDVRVTEAVREATIHLNSLDRGTIEHQWRTAELCGGIGARIGLTEKRLRTLVTAATLHDVGKLFIPAGLLHRPGPLSSDEYELIRDHSAHGEQWLLQHDVPAPIPDIVRWHHERWDGRGYPDRLAGKAIPVESRVLALADAMDAMLSQRPYHGGRSLKDVRKILISESGSAFDPAVVEAALSLWE